MTLKNFNIKQGPKNYWLKKPAIGFRRIILIYTFLTTLIVISLYFHDYLNLALIVLTEVALAMYFIKKLKDYGYYHRLEEFEVDSQKLELRDYILPSGKKESVRELVLKDKKFAYSRVFLDPKNKKAAAYKYCELFAKTCPYEIKKALILGGGGCSVSLMLSKYYPQAVVDMVEISPKIIKIAKKYFLRDKNLDKNLIFYNEDAYKFCQKNSDMRYDFIFVDIFVGNKVPEKFFKEEFCSCLNNLLHIENGILIVNAGYAQINEAGRLVEQYRKIFKITKIFIFEGKIVLLISRRDIHLGRELTDHLFISFRKGQV